MAVLAYLQNVVAGDNVFKGEAGGIAGYFGYVSSCSLTLGEQLQDHRVGFGAKAGHVNRYSCRGCSGTAILAIAVDIAVFRGISLPEKAVGKDCRLILRGVGGHGDDSKLIFIQLHRVLVAGIAIGDNTGVFSAAKVVIDVSVIFNGAGPLTQGVQIIVAFIRKRLFFQFLIVYVVAAAVIDEAHVKTVIGEAAVASQLTDGVGVVLLIVVNSVYVPQLIQNYGKGAVAIGKALKVVAGDGHGAAVAAVDIVLGAFMIPLTGQIIEHAVHDMRRILAHGIHCPEITVVVETLIQGRQSIVRVAVAADVAGVGHLGRLAAGGGCGEGMDVVVTRCRVLPIPHMTADAANRGDGAGLGAGGIRQLFSNIPVSQRFIDLKSGLVAKLAGILNATAGDTGSRNGLSLKAVGTTVVGCPDLKLIDEQVLVLRREIGIAPGIGVTVGAYTVELQRTDVLRNPEAVQRITLCRHLRTGGAAHRAACFIAVAADAGPVRTGGIEIDLPQLFTADQTQTLLIRAVAGTGDILVLQGITDGAGVFIACAVAGIRHFLPGTFAMECSKTQTVILNSNVHAVPLFFYALIIDMVGPAVRKCVIANHRDTFRKCYAAKVVTAVERGNSDRSDALRDGHAEEVAAVRERSFSDPGDGIASDGVRDHQVAADRGITVGNGDLLSGDSVFQIAATLDLKGALASLHSGRILRMDRECRRQQAQTENQCQQDG